MLCHSRKLLPEVKGTESGRQARDTQQLRRTCCRPRLRRPSPSDDSVHSWDESDMGTFASEVYHKLRARGRYDNAALICSGLPRRDGMGQSSPTPPFAFPVFASKTRVESLRANATKLGVYLRKTLQQFKKPGDRGALFGLQFADDDIQL
ncbi:hypothetical protein F5Y14DRAFT_435438 [Nemania sp. NC0429]|nr:hypothetical protein F5Y14DRAFT_435438 [Nemania sp. NC0429]